VVIYYGSDDPGALIKFGYAMLGILSLGFLIAYALGRRPPKDMPKKSLTDAPTYPKQDEV